MYVCIKNLLKGENSPTSDFKVRGPPESALFFFKEKAHRKCPGDGRRALALSSRKKNSPEKERERAEMKKKN